MCHVLATSPRNSQKEWHEDEEILLSCFEVPIGHFSGSSLGCLSIHHISSCYNMLARSSQHQYGRHRDLWLKATVSVSFCCDPRAAADFPPLDWSPFDWAWVRANNGGSCTLVCHGCNTAEDILQYFHNKMIPCACRLKWALCPCASTHTRITIPHSKRWSLFSGICTFSCAMPSSPE